MRTRVGAIAHNTFREAVRDRVLYNLIAFALLLVSSALIIQQISIGIERLLVVNLGLTAVSLFGIVIAIFIGIGLVSKEIEKRTLYTVLARPVRRWEFILGKFAGLVGTLVVNTCFMAVGFFAALLYVARRFEFADVYLLVALYFIILQFMIIIAIALLFSSFSSPLLSAVFTFSVFLIGSLSEDLRAFAAMAAGLPGAAATGLTYLVPNFSALNVVSSVAHGRPVGGSLILFNTLYALLYAGAALAASALVFEEKKLEVTSAGMSYPAKVTAVFSTILALSLSASAFLLTRIDGLRTQTASQEMLYLPSSSVLKRLSLGYTGLVADIYWTRAVQYFGDKHHQRPVSYQLLAPLLEIATDLDPALIVAYRFGAVFLAQKPPEGAGLPDKAVDLVEKGIRNNPGEWQLYYDLGFLHAMERNDYLAAANAFARGAAVPHAHPSMKILAAAMAQHGGDRSTARLLWTTTLQSTEDKMIRENALKHLVALRVEDEVEQLEALVRQYQESTGRRPSRFAELVSARYLSGIPVDPRGLPYDLRPDGRVAVQQPEGIPFITRGLPPGKQASIPGLPQSNQQEPY